MFAHTSCADYESMQNLYEQTLTECVALKQQMTLQEKQRKALPPEEKPSESEAPVVITAPEPDTQKEIHPSELSKYLEAVIMSLKQ